MSEVKLTDLQIAKTSPAIERRSEDAEYPYPKHFKNMVPLKVRMNKTVVPDMILSKKHINMKAEYSSEYYVWVNSYGAVSAILPDGEKLGLKPGEFQVIEFH